MNARTARIPTRTLFWLAYFAFAACAVAHHGGAHALTFATHGTGKAVVLVAWLAFLAYTLWCSARENLFRSIAQIARLHWGRQVGLDLYIGFALAAAGIGLVTGSSLVALAWLVPILVYGNLATLLFVVLEWETIVARLG